MERNCLMRTVYRTSLVNHTTAIGGGDGANNVVAGVKSQRNKACGRAAAAAATEEDFINGISWPPRSYTCNFCKREFKSAQALGGHMNVHRRDRALLYSPPSENNNNGQFTNLNLNLNHNPNPNPNLPCHDDRKASDLKAEIAKLPNVFDKARYWNKKGEKFIGLDIEISTTTSVLTDHSNKDIDLELRLGYST